jgi:hypothetical protein
MWNLTFERRSSRAAHTRHFGTERLIGSIQRECVDHFIVLGEAHLHRILRSYAGYYNDIRTHWSLDKDAPVSRSVQRTGIIGSSPILGGLHHLSLPKTSSENHSALRPVQIPCSRVQIPCSLAKIPCFVA